MLACRREPRCTSASPLPQAIPGPTQALERYLANHAEPVARADFVAHSAQDRYNIANINACRSGCYRWVLVVPAFDEPLGFHRRIIQKLSFSGQAKGCLLIRVLNAPADATAEQRQRTLSALPNRAGNEPEPIGNGVHMLTLDAVSEPLAEDEATGLARKLGNDVACRLLVEGHIKTPMLCNTDADAILPEDYFARLNKALTADPTRATAAWILPFTHWNANPALHNAGMVYELYLRSLYLNLQRCGSPYGYPALGSVLALNPRFYATSRGFPKRRAGEDFYLLNKLAKLADVVYLTGAPVQIAARASHRVPFGTGPAILRLLQPAADNKRTSSSTSIVECKSYALNSFALLRQFYTGVTDLRAITSAQARRAAARQLPPVWRDPDLYWLLKRIGLPGALVRLLHNHRTDEALQRAVHEWFDALKVVRFLNEARHFHPDELLLDQLEHLGSFLPKQDIPSRAAQDPLVEEPTESGGLGAVDPASEILQRASTINRLLENNRAVSRHCVPHYLSLDP